MFSFQSRNQSIEILFLNKEKRMSEKYILDNYPNEKCEICESQIIIENCFYNLDEKKIRYYCPNCNNLCNVDQEYCPRCGLKLKSW